MRPVLDSTFVLVGGLLAYVALGGLGCKSPPAELDPASSKDTANAKGTTAPSGTSATGAAKADPGAGASSSGSAAAGEPGRDPLGGTFSLSDALKDVPGKGAIIAKIETSKGALQCRLFEDKAPVTVANFIGLATGKRAWKDSETGVWVNKHAYDGTTFHRIIKGFMIQGGDAKGTGAGEPGYVIKDELWEGAKHDRAGLLCMANRGPNTNGAQFFITDAAAAHLDRSYTIFGECAPVEVVHDIANVPTGIQDKPQATVIIKSITVSRDEKKK